MGHDEGLLRDFQRSLQGGAAGMGHVDQDSEVVTFFRTSAPVAVRPPRLVPPLISPRGATMSLLSWSNCKSRSPRLYTSSILSTWPSMKCGPSTALHDHLFPALVCALGVPFATLTRAVQPERRHKWRS